MSNKKRPRVWREAGAYGSSVSEVHKYSFPETRGEQFSWLDESGVRVLGPEAMRYYEENAEARRNTSQEFFEAYWRQQDATSIDDWEVEADAGEEAFSVDLPDVSPELHPSGIWGEISDDEDHQSDITHGAPVAHTSRSAETQRRIAQMPIVEAMKPQRYRAVMYGGDGEDMPQELHETLFRPRTCLSNPPKPTNLTGLDAAILKQYTNHEKQEQYLNDYHMDMDHAEVDTARRGNDGRLESSANVTAEDYPQESSYAESDSSSTAERSPVRHLAAAVNKDLMEAPKRRSMRGGRAQKLQLRHGHGFFPSKFGKRITAFRSRTRQGFGHKKPSIEAVSSSARSSLSKALRLHKRDAAKHVRSQQTVLMFGCPERNSHSPNDSTSAAVHLEESSCKAGRARKGTKSTRKSLRLRETESETEASDTQVEETEGVEDWAPEGRSLVTRRRERVGNRELLALQTETTKFLSRKSVRRTAALASPAHRWIEHMPTSELPFAKSKAAARRTFSRVGSGRHTAANWLPRYLKAPMSNPNAPRAPESEYVTVPTLINGASSPRELAAISQPADPKRTRASKRLHTKKD